MFGRLDSVWFDGVRDGLANYMETVVWAVELETTIERTDDLIDETVHELSRLTRRRNRDCGEEIGE
ncbi:hypothetical protein [Haloarcula sp. JP-L23]|uniref:hypothetical protein n=1 Tax=Haloarcula sp. JP-L23 TaxID=2716717 RepID=UPI00140F253D|nr:hypothetical protein G9465_23790 [Haloarcula sp. JP-L23]